MPFAYITKRRRPVRLVWHASFDSIRSAYYFEKQVQGWSRAKRIALIEGRWDDLPDLSRSKTGMISTGSIDGDVEPG